jgi:hypothetical protein
MVCIIVGDIKAIYTFIYIPGDDISGWIIHETNNNLKTTTFSLLWLDQPPS